MSKTNNGANLGGQHADNFYPAPGEDEETVRRIPGRTHQVQGARESPDCIGVKLRVDTSRREWSFEKLVGFIQHVHDELAAQAGRAVNLSLTLRNWLIGCHIAEYELCGLDRASYGDSLLTELAKRLTGLNVSNCNRRQLYRYLRFYRLYPEIVGTMSAQLKKLLPAGGQAVEKVGTASPQLRIPPTKLIHRLSYSHLELIVDLDDPFKHSFYEIECIRGNWSVRELKRQINSLYYERSGLSKDKTKLAVLAQEGAETAEPKLAIRDPYIFEFLGLKPKEVLSESHLEEQLLDKLQEFLLELGHGFCFEARQKRILIGDTHNFVDLVFYHRILKCHVLVELKLDEFNHENIGQLNTYRANNWKYCAWWVNARKREKLDTFLKYARVMDLA